MYEQLNGKTIEMENVCVYIYLMDYCIYSFHLYDFIHVNSTVSRVCGFWRCLAAGRDTYDLPHYLKINSEEIKIYDFLIDMQRLVSIGHLCDPPQT